MCKTPIQEVEKRDYHKRGNQHYRWNNEKMISSGGYVRVRVGREHPLADCNGYAYEHLLVWVAAGRKLPARNEILHHIDEDKQHNEIGNLMLITRNAHNAEHQARKYGRKAITVNDVLSMRERRAAGEQLNSIARDYSLHFRTVQKIVRGERYKNVVKT